MDLVLKNAKSLISAAVALLGGLQVGLSNNGLDASEVIGAVIAALVALGATYALPNKGQADAQAVVDQVKKLVPPAAAKAIADVVPAARGVLKDVS